MKMKKIANLYLMDREKSGENNESEGGNIRISPYLHKECLGQGLLKCVKFERDHVSEIKALGKENKVLEKENETS